MNETCNIQTVWCQSVENAKNSRNHIEVDVNVAVKVDVSKDEDLKVYSKRLNVQLKKLFNLTLLNLLYQKDQDIFPDCMLKVSQKIKGKKIKWLLNSGAAHSLVNIGRPSSVLT